MSGSSLKIGVLGASRIAELAIVGPAHELGHRLVAVAARDPQRAQLFAEKHGVERILASYDEVVNDPEVDVVYNPLANAMHAPWNLAAVAAGKPVLTEKPFARDRAEAQRVAAVEQYVLPPRPVACARPSPSMERTITSPAQANLATTLGNTSTLTAWVKTAQGQ